MSEKRDVEVLPRRDGGRIQNGCVRGQPPRSGGVVQAWAPIGPEGEELVPTVPTPASVPWFGETFPRQGTGWGRVWKGPPRVGKGRKHRGSTTRGVGGRLSHRQGDQPERLDKKMDPSPKLLPSDPEPEGQGHGVGSARQR